MELQYEVVPLKTGILGKAVGWLRERNFKGDDVASYFASSARAKIPAARGADAEVPV